MDGEVTLQATAQRQAYDFIRGEILSGAYPGGAKVNPQTVALRLGISRMPVREAIRQLDSEGLVTIRPNRGAIVTVLTPKEIAELFEMRAVLEALAARLALPRLQGEALEELELLRQRMDRVRGDAKTWILRHNAFHNYLCGLSDRPRLAAEIDRFRTAVQPYLLMSISVYQSTEMPHFEHEAIIDAVRSRNLARLESCMRDHVLSAARGVIEFLEQRGNAARPVGKRAAAASARRRPAVTARSR